MGVPLEESAPLSKETGHDGLEFACWATRESAAFVRDMDFEPSATAFDAAFGRE